MKIALLGDIAFYGKFSLSNENIYQYFSNIAKKLSEYDYVVANLETPFAENYYKKNGSKSAYLKSDPNNIRLLKFLGVKAVSLSNNHMFDYGIDSYELTKKILLTNKIEFFGVEKRELKITLKENKIAFGAYTCYSTNPLNVGSQGINALNYLELKNAILKNMDEGFYNIVSIHAGQEHVNYPNYDHILLARKLAELGPYTYYGHHPHVLQGIEKKDEALIAYSLGNFCFDDVYTEKSNIPLVKMSDNNKSSVVLELEIENNKLINHRITPIFDSVLLQDEFNEKILDDIKTYSERLNLKKEIYIYEREILLSKYLQTRKSKRDIMWYLKRLNIDSLKMLLNARKNSKAYYKNLKMYL